MLHKYKSILEQSVDDALRTVADNIDAERKKKLGIDDNTKKSINPFKLHSYAKELEAKQKENNTNYQNAVKSREEQISRDSKSWNPIAQINSSVGQLDKKFMDDENQIENKEYNDAIQTAKSRRNKTGAAWAGAAAGVGIAAKLALDEKNKRSNWKKNGCSGIKDPVTKAKCQKYLKGN